MPDVIPEIADDLPSVLSRLESLGLKILRSEYSPEDFGNYYVDFDGPRGQFRIARDRSQYFLEADRALLEKADLWRAFDNREIFTERVIKWLGKKVKGLGWCWSNPNQRLHLIAAAGLQCR